MNKKKYLKLIELLVAKRRDIRNNSYVAKRLGITVDELKALIKKEIYPIGKKDLENNIASEEACFYLSFAAEEALSKCKIYNSSNIANIRQIWPEYINGTKEIRGIKSVELEPSEEKFLRETYNATGILAKTLKWACVDTVKFTNKVTDLFCK